MSKARREARRPIVHAMLYPRLEKVAQKLGYALALHGSIARDMDLIAVPWIDQAAAPSVLIEAMAKRVGGYHHGKPAKKPHGRLAWVIHIPDVFFNDSKPFYLDIGVMHLHRYTAPNAPEGE